MLPQAAKLKGIALDLLFPQWCVGCGKEGSLICDSCRRTLQDVVPPLCPRCGRPQSSETYCPACAGGEVHIDGIRSPFIFDGVLRQAIHQFKYHNLRALAAPLAGLLYDYLAAAALPGDVVVPVPLHPRRLRERGYNQSGLLARELGKLAGLPVIEGCLIRQRHTPPQVRTANAAARKQNMADAFTCRDRRMLDRQVLLLDDVATSGATLDACAAALKADGAASVWGLVMAREL